MIKTDLEDQTDYTNRMKAVAEKLAVNPVAQAAESLAWHSPIPSHLDTQDLETVLAVDMEAVVSEGNFAALERILFAQALTLNSLFHAVVQKAGEKPEFLKNYLDLALRVQKQSRNTMEVLHRFKHPTGSGIVQNMNAQNIQVNTDTNKLLDRENDHGSDMD